jgi:hypothetical protein
MKSHLLALPLLIFPAGAQSVNGGHGLRIGRIQTAELLSFNQKVLYVEFETWVEQLPREHSEGIISSFSAIDENGGKALMTRFVRDHLREMQVSYSLQLELEPDGSGYLATLKPTPSGEGAKAPRGWKMLSPPELPGPQLVRDGDILKVNLYERPTGSQIVEYVRFATRQATTLRDVAPHEAYAEDAEFSISQPKLRANGRSVKLADVETLHGSVLRLKVPGLGNYLVSLKPHPGLDFEYAGEISGDSLNFKVGPNLFRVDCSDRIASGSAAYNVYAVLDGPFVADGSTASLTVPGT